MSETESRSFESRVEAEEEKTTASPSAVSTASTLGPSPGVPFAPADARTRRPELRSLTYTSATPLRSSPLSGASVLKATRVPSAESDSEPTPYPPRLPFRPAGGGGGGRERVRREVLDVDVRPRVRVPRVEVRS